MNGVKMNTSRMRLVPYAKLNQIVKIEKDINVMKFARNLGISYDEFMTLNHVDMFDKQIIVFDLVSSNQWIEYIGPLLKISSNMSNGFLLTNNQIGLFIQHKQIIFKFYNKKMHIHSDEILVELTDADDELLNKLNCVINSIRYGSIKTAKNCVNGRKKLTIERTKDNGDFVQTSHKCFKIVIRNPNTYLGDTDIDLATIKGKHTRGDVAFHLVSNYGNNLFRKQPGIQFYANAVEVNLMHMHEHIPNRPILRYKMMKRREANKIEIPYILVFFLQIDFYPLYY